MEGLDFPFTDLDTHRISITFTIVAGDVRRFSTFGAVRIRATMPLEFSMICCPGSIPYPARKITLATSLPRIPLLPLGIMFGTPLVIILTATGMYAYWLMRSWLFMHADEDEIVHTLEIDVWAMNNWKKVLRSFFLPLELR